MTIAKLKSNSVISREVSGTLVIFRVNGAGQTVLDLTKLHPNVASHALIHGMCQRVQDAAAISRDTKTGKPADPQTKLEAMAELVDHYNSGTAEWSLRREGGGIGRSYLLNALCQLRPEKPREEVQSWIKSLSDKERRALENHSDIKPLIDAQRAQGAEDVDTDELLKGL